MGHITAYRHCGRYPGLPAYVIAEWTELPSWLDIVETLFACRKGGPRRHASRRTVNAIYTYVLVRCQLRDTAALAPRRQLAPVKR